MLLALCALGAPPPVHSQTNAAAQAAQLFQQERWEELVRLGSASNERTAEFNYEYGVALARRERWNEARSVLEAGSRLAPRDKRFSIELAGVAFKQKNNRLAISYLRRALHLDPGDGYAHDFLATLYFLEGNLEAALQHWNVVGKPQIAQARIEPELRIRPGLLDRAFVFAPQSNLLLEDLRATQARLNEFEIFPSYKFDLVAQPEGNFDTVFRAQELNGFGSTKLDALLRLLRGLPFQEIDPEYFNLARSDINITSQLRWDPQKRRFRAAVSGPLAHDARWRFRITAGLRNENWALVPSFSGQTSLLATLNLRREEIGAEVVRLSGSRWRWSLGAEISRRDYRNVFAGTALAPELLAAGYQLKQTAQLDSKLWRWPERRITISGAAASHAARLWSQPAQTSERIQGSLDAHWYPQSRGDDFETLGRLRSGKTFGEIPFDELLMLGLERDNDLLLRAHAGTRDGRKGSAPLGRNYVLWNWETDKNVYSNGLFSFKLGPFLDTGKITDPSLALGSAKWLWDTGAQAKVRVLGVGVAFSYGKDLRSGNNVFYVMLMR